MSDFNFTITDGDYDVPLYYWYDGSTFQDSIKIWFHDGGGLEAIYEGPGFLDSPSNLSATGVGTGQIDLTWTLNTGSEDCVIVENSEDGGSSWAVLESCLAEGTESYSHTGIDDQGEENHYRVKVSKTYSDGSTEESNYSNTDAGVTNINAPENLSVSATSDSETSLSWDNATGLREEGTVTEIHRDDGSGFTEVDTVDDTTTTYSDTGLSSGTTYTYKLRYDADKHSGFSNTDSATTTAVAAETLWPDSDYNQLTSDWTDSDGDGDGWDELDANDSNTIKTEVFSGNSQTSTHTVTLENPAEAHNDTQTWAVQARWNSLHSDCDSGGSLTVTLSDTNGSIESQTFSHTDDTASTDSFTLTDTEVNNLDINSLRIKVETTVTSPCCSNCDGQFPTYGSEGVAINFVNLDIS